MLRYTDEALNLDELRQRLRKMDDAALLRWGRAGVFMCSPEANFGKPPRDCFVVQMAEARAEWKRRHVPNSLIKRFRWRIFATRATTPHEPTSKDHMPSCARPFVLRVSGSGKLQFGRRENRP